MDRYPVGGPAQQSPSSYTPPQPGGDAEGHPVRLGFRVLRWSSADDGYTGTSLESATPKSRGWQSARFCDYPQELVFSLDGVQPSEIRKLQILSHQSKIASRIEVYVSETSWDRVRHDPALYTKVGYFSLQTNSQSEYRARELKDVYLRTRARVLRLLLYRNHVNPVNMYSQIGIVAFNILGTKSQISGPSDMALDLQMDEVTIRQLRDLHSAKQRAVQMEDYDTAQRIKEAMDRLKQVGSQLAQLEAQKRVAVVNEDYELAKKLKAKIEYLRGSSSTKSNRMPQMNNAPERVADQKTPQRPISTMHQVAMREPNIDERHHEMEHHPGDNLSYEVRTGDNVMQHASPGTGPSPFVSPSRVVNSVPYDERPLPSMGKPPMDFSDDNVNPFGARLAQNKKKSNVGAEDDGNEFETDIPLPALADTDRGEAAEILAAYHNEEIARGLFSRTWQHRCLALQKCANVIKQVNASTSQEKIIVFVTGTVAVLQRTIPDTIAQVSVQSMQVFEDLLEKVYPHAPHSVVNSSLDQVLPMLLERLARSAAGRPFARAREAMHKVVKLQSYLSHISRHLLAPLRKKAPKPWQVRVELLTELIETAGGVSEHAGLGLGSIVTNFCLPALRHKNVQVREAGVILACALHRAVGDNELLPLLRDVNPNLMNTLVKAFARQGGASVENGGMEENPTKLVSSPPLSEKATDNARGGHVLSEKEAIATKRESRGAERAEQLAPSPTLPRQEKELEVAPASNAVHEDYAGEEFEEFDEYADEEYDERVCRFCGVEDDSFLQEENLDLHYWRICPMLVSCKLCEQVVEIPTLFDHLINECEASNDVAVCGACSQPFVAAELNSHKRHGYCRVVPSPAHGNRCPLCYADIQPGEEGWRQHLLIQGCTRNDRDNTQARNQLAK